MVTPQRDPLHAKQLLLSDAISFYIQCKKESCKKIENFMAAGVPELNLVFYGFWLYSHENVYFVIFVFI